MILKIVIGIVLLTEPMLIFYGSNYQIGTVSALALLLTALTKNLRLYRFTIDASAILVGISAWALLVLIFTQSDVNVDSTRSILRPLRACIGLLGFWAFVAIFVHRRYISGPDDLLLAAVKAALACILLNAVIICIQFSSPAVLDFSYRTFAAGEILDVNKAQRMPGLFSSGGATVSAFQGFGILLSAYIYRSQSKSNATRFLLPCTLIVVSAILTGRTGLLFLPIAYLYLALSSNRSDKPTNFDAASFRKILQLSGLTLLLIAILISLVSFASRVEVFDAGPTLTALIYRTFETPLNYLETGEFKDRTILVIATEQVVFPDNFTGLLLGDPSLLQNKGNYNSDVGYIRLIFGYGVIGLFLHIMFYVCLYINIRSSYLSQHSMTFINIVFFSIFLLNGKELFFLARGAHNILIFIAVAAIVGGVKYKGR